MKIYCIVQAEDKRDPFGAEPHFGIDEELMLAMGKKFLAGGGKLTHIGRSYSVSKSTFIVIEMESNVVGSSTDEVRAFFDTKARERTKMLLYRCTEDLLREYGKDITREVLGNLEQERKAAAPQRTEIGSSAHASLWALLHPRIVQLSQQLFADGHRKEAVQAALTEIDEVVARKYRVVHKDGKHGTAMMAKTFAKDAPVVQLFRLDDPMYGDLQEGYMHLFMGVMQAMRNPKSHSNFQIDERDAIEMLFLASRLLRKIDEAIKP